MSRNLLSKMFFLDSQKIRIWWAFFTKDFKNTYRFRGTIVRDVFQPITSFLSLLLTYSAVFFVGKVASVGYIDRSNYLVYLSSGFLAYSFARTCWNKTSLRWEKYMLTLEGVLVSPVNSAYILAGKSFNAFFSVGLSTLPYVLVLIMLAPPIVSLTRLVAGILCLFCLFSLFLSIDFMLSGLEMSGEGWTDFIRTYAPMGFGLLSCVYFPPSILPRLIRPLVWINPIYITVSVFRSAFIPTTVSNIYAALAYLMALATIMPVLATKVFEYLFYERGIKGY